MRQIGVQILRYSSLYETSPEGITDQPDFLNAAVLATTSDPPRTLLRKLKQIEAEMGRDFTAVRYGPRSIDFDIIFYGNQEMREEGLTIPHPRWMARDFVKVLLRDLAQSYSSVHTASPHTVKGRLSEAEKTPIEDDDEKVRQVAVLGRDHLESFGTTTWMMHILNITPDSFSDGGSFLSADRQELNKVAVLESAQKAVSCGARIIDIGGQSTRPGSSAVSEEIEGERVFSVIRLLKEELGETCPYLSVDTFYASVAREAVELGADLVNDISGGERDPQMRQTVAELDVPIVLMHMRGTPQTMTHVENLSYSTDPIRDIGMELQIVSEESMESGIPAWKQILDPGIGFSKTTETSFRVLQELGRMRSEILKGTCAKMPLLIGLSRKRFLTAFTGQNAPHERDVVSCAAALDCVRNGADIIRLHNPEMSCQVLSLADALYRTQRQC